MATVFYVGLPYKQLAKKGEYQDVNRRASMPGFEGNFRSKDQIHLLFMMLVVFALLALGIGAIGMSKSIRSPFVPRVASTVNSAASSLTNNNEESAATLLSRDTDEDGLNDYAELYQYGTSPYLMDSDSDDLSDKEELESGNDPNCPTGQDCTGMIRPANANASTNTNTTGTAANNNAQTSIPTTAEGTVDLAALREILKNSGAPAYIVDGTDDAALLELYQSTLAEADSTTTNANLSTNAATNASPTEADMLTQLSALSATEIRQLLINNGVDQTILDKATDEELKEIFLDALSQETTTE